jgi:type VI secretion system protein VasD
LILSRRLLLALPAILAAGCSSPPRPAVLTLTAIGGAGQHPDASGRPATVAVRLFQVKSNAAFERADVFALTEREQQTLGADGWAWTNSS